jgi:hypothetical protein
VTGMNAVDHNTQVKGAIWQCNFYVLLSGLEALVPPFSLNCNAFLTIN